MEHLLSLITTIHTANKCRHVPDDPIKNVMLLQLPHIFHYLHYTPALAVVGKVVNVLSTFVWTFMDVFVMMISVGLVSRFRQINRSLTENKGRAMPVRFWVEHRIYYRNMCDLCETIDREIGHITLVSFSNNLWFICVQLLFSLKCAMGNGAERMMICSILVLQRSAVGGSCAVLLVLVDIPDHANAGRVTVLGRHQRRVQGTAESLSIGAARIVVPRSRNSDARQRLACTPQLTALSHLQLKRFYNEVTRDVVALSGMRFFHLTRTLVLSVAGTIITYELVLVQFHTGESKEPECKLDVLY